MVPTTETVPHSQGQLAEATAQSFVPRLLLRRLAAAPLTEPERQHVRGALLLSDIESFTAHIERLAQRGPQGLEEVISGFHRYFATLVSAVASQGGDILTVAGDSLLCWWPAGHEEDLPQAAAQAARAALAVQQALASSDPAGLATRIGIAVGDMDIGLAGGVRGRWELVPSGPAISDLVSCEAGAAAGSVLLSAAAVRALGDRADTRPAASGKGELVALNAPESRSPPTAFATNGVPAPALAALVPAPVLRWGDSDQEWLAEFRRVTAVMANLSAPATPEGFARQHQAIVAFQRTVARFDGAAKVQFDGKGVTCSAVFGLPPRAHQDDVDRGLRAARALQRSLHELGFGAGVGVSSGRVCCGVFGTDARREYTLFGDAVNVAARLSSIAADEVLIDDTTSESALQALEVERRPVLALKNRVEPVRVHRLLALRQAHAAAPRMVGRGPELSILRDAIQQLVDGGTAACVVVEGELGIGKSTLAAEAMGLAAAAGARTFTITAEPVDRTSAYHAWHELFAGLLGGVNREDELLRRVGAQPHQAALLPLLNPFLSQPLPENDLCAGLQGEARVDQLNALLVATLAQQTAHQPWVLLVEDVQWLDSTSCALLARAVADVPRIVIIATERIEEVERTLASELARLRAQPHTRVLKLGPLPAEETAALVRQCLHTREVSPEILQLVLERVSGHPFFCEALLETMIERGAIHVTGNGAQLGRNAEVSVPASVEGAVISRLDRLQVGQQLALKAAAVVGRTFTVAEVAAAHPTAPAEAVRDQLEVLRELELVKLEGESRAEVYAFRHQIIESVAYELLTGSQRRQMHAALAERYESGGDTAATAQPELLAHHFGRAGLFARAAPYLEQAGRRALHLGAFAEAVQLLEQAVRAAPDATPERRALQEKALADAHYFLGDLLHSRALLEQALERLGRPTRSSRIELTRGLTDALAEQARHLAAPRHYIGSRSGERETLLAVADALRTLVQISYLHATSALELGYLVVSGLNVAELAGPSPELARALANAAALADVGRRRGLADRYAERAIRLAAEEGHAPASAYVWNVLAIMHAARGTWDTALAHNEEALKLFERVGDYNLESELWQTRSALSLCLGSLPQAEAAWRRTRELAQRTGSPVNRCWSLLDEAQTELAREQTDEGARALEAALAIPIVDSDGGTVIERKATTALARLQQGRYAEAVREADAVVAMLSGRLPTGWVWAEFGVLAVEVLLELRANGAAGVPVGGLDRRIRRGLRALRRVALTFRGIHVRVLVLRARAALIAGAQADAQRLLAEAEAQARRPDQRLDRARVAMLEAELCPEPAQRRRLLEEPLQVLGELGQERERRRALALLQ